MWLLISIHLVRLRQFEWQTDCRSTKEIIVWCTWRSTLSRRSHWISQVDEARDLYSALDELLYTVGCFYDFQEMGESPRWTTYENILERNRIHEENMWPDICYIGHNSLKNCIAWSSVFLCEIRVTIPHEHLTKQLQIGSSLKLSNSSQLILNLVKNSVTVESPCFGEETSICNSGILKR